MMAELKKTANDFIFDRSIGEGSFSTVYLAKDVNTKIEYAIKVCEKKLIRREKKHLAIMREKQIMKILTDNPSPFFIKLFCTFQDNDRLFFVMNYAKNGELLPFIKVESFDENCCRFYSAEILLALEYLHKLGIVHRDLKPENILLNEKMHIQVIDFGSALILNDNNLESSPSPTVEPSKDNETHTRRKNSFVGTAHYVSPEMLTNESATTSCDLWAFGCILYQMISGLPPFRASNEYLIFQKITTLEYEFVHGLNDAAKSLIENILQINPSKRLGANDHLQKDGYVSIKEHAFFAPLANNWSLINQTPPTISSNLSGDSANQELRNNFETPENLEPGLAERQITRLMGLALHEDFDMPNIKTIKGILDISPKEMNERLRIQRQTNDFHRYVEENLILKQGFIDKKKGLFARRRMFLLTTGPHLYYVDATNKVLKGQIPWSRDMRAEAKNFKIFYVHTPNRIYYLEDTLGDAPEWCKVIEEVRRTTFSNSSGDNLSNTSSNLCNTNVPLRKISINDKKLR